MQMFCGQCAQSKDSRGCFESLGVCRKTAEVANLQDELMSYIKQYGAQAHQKGDTAASAHVNAAMFTTLTNVNNDPARFKKLIAETRKRLNGAAADSYETGSPNVLPQRQAASDDNASALCEMLEYGLKGIAAYAHHAEVGGKQDPRVNAFILEALAFLEGPQRNDLGAALNMCLRAGEANLWTMETLYNANVQLGVPEPATVPCSPTKGKCVLISGHDLVVMEKLLEACEKNGINVYTHGEMLPGHSYPNLKKYKNLAGHFGGSWNRQHHEFKHFPGPIVMTSNCIIEPLSSYKSKMFTFGPVGWPGCTHIGDTLQNIDFTNVLSNAEASAGFTNETEFGYQAVSKEGQPSPKQPWTVGFGHSTVLGAAETVIAGVKAGAITRFHLIGGCDGDEAARKYYTELAENLPEGAVVLTLGCGKFRFSDEVRAKLGTIGDTGIPRVLDMGQCNDTYSAVQVAVALAGAFECKVTDLPLSITLCWLEQKAIAVLLTCLHLGLKPIRVGPTLPAFVTGDVLNVLVNDFGVKVVGDPKKDIEEMHAASGMS